MCRILSAASRLDIRGKVCTVDSKSLESCGKLQCIQVCWIASAAHNLVENMFTYDGRSWKYIDLFRSTGGLFAVEVISQCLQGLMARLSSLAWPSSCWPRPAPLIRRLRFLPLCPAWQVAGLSLLSTYLCSLLLGLQQVSSLNMQQCAGSSDQVWWVCWSDCHLARHSWLLIGSNWYFFPGMQSWLEAG